MPDPLVRLDVDDGVGVVRLERPPANAISLQLGLDLVDVLEEAGSRDDVGAIVLWGGPKLLAAGADIKEMVDHGPDEIRKQVGALGDACDLLEALPKLSIAVITGFAPARYTNVDTGAPGPTNTALLYTPADVVSALPGLEITRAESVRRPVELEDGTSVEAVDALVVATRRT